MKFQKQRSPHMPEIGVYGDCYRTALACILDLDREEVPHFLQLYADKTDEERSQIADTWLRGRGYSIIHIPYCLNEEDRISISGLLDILAKQNGYDLIYLLTGLNKSGNKHIVICRGKEVLWDPSPTDAGVVSPIDDTYWVTHLIPVRMRMTYGEMIHELGNVGAL